MCGPISNYFFEISDQKIIATANSKSKTVLYIRGWADQLHYYHSNYRFSLYPIREDILYPLCLAIRTSFEIAKNIMEPLKKYYYLLKIRLDD
jgi:hypothetical protein